MTTQLPGAWDQLVDELKVFPKEEDIHDKMMDPMVSPPLVRSTSTHAEQDGIENKMFFNDKSGDLSENKQITANIANRASIQSQKSIFRVSKNRPQSSRASSKPSKPRRRSSSFQRTTDSDSNESTLASSRSRRRSGSFDMKNYMRARSNSKYTYNPRKPGFAFGTAQRRLHGKSDSIPPPGSYMPKVGIGHDATTSSKFHSTSKRFAHNYRIGSTPQSMGPGMYSLPSSFSTHSFNVKAGRGGTFSRSKRMNYKVDKNIPNASRYYPKVDNYTKKGSAMSKAKRFASPEVTEMKNKVPVGQYDVNHIVNHDKQAAYYPISNRKIASKIGKK